MKSQTQHFYASHAQIAKRNETFDWMRKTNPITAEELIKLKQKNPKTWNGLSLTGAN